MDNNIYSEKSLQESWRRFLDNTYSCEDLSLILDSLKNDSDFPEFYEASEKAWRLSIATMTPETEEQKEMYRKEAVQFISEYERNRKMRSKQIHSRNTNRFRKIFYYAAAAVLFLGLLIPTTYHFTERKTEQTADVRYIELVTNRGEIKTIVLPDHTKVTLNAESKIIYPDVFVENKRSVELFGEALFEVSPDPDRLFLVKTENMKVKVLGTVFNIKNYADDRIATVSVVSGKVNVDLVEGKVLLEGNRQVVLDKTTKNFEKSTVDAGKYLSWINGTLYFNRTSIREVVNMLKRFYPQVEIELAEDEYPNLISGEHGNKSIEAVLTSIVYMTGLKCEKNGNKFYISK